MFIDNNYNNNSLSGGVRLGGNLWIYLLKMF